MSAKVTLSINETVLKKAKTFAKNNHTSLSKLFENYLSDITGKENDVDEISPLVRSLSGVLKLPDNFDYKKDKAKYLESKYG